MTEFDRRAQELAKLLLPRGQSRGQPASLLQGVVIDVNLGRLTVFLEGDTEFPVSGVRHVPSYVPLIGDVIWLIRSGVDTWALGRLDPKVGNPAIEDWRIIGVGGEPAFANGWSNFGIDGHGVAAFAIQSDGWVHLKGLIANGTDAATMFTLPEGYRPATTMRLCSIASDAACEIRVSTNGNVNKQQGGSNAFVSLSGLMFPSAEFYNKTQPIWKRVALEGIWKLAATDGAFPEIYQRSDGFCWLKGVPIDGTAGTSWAIVPETCRVGWNGTVIQSGMAADGISRSDVNRDGHLRHLAGIVNSLAEHIYGGVSWWSEWGKQYTNWIAPNFLNGWTNYTSIDAQYQPLQYFKDDFGIVHLRGLVRGVSKTSDVVFTLPTGFRPNERLFFLTYRNNGGHATGRTEVRSNGNVETFLGGSIDHHSIWGRFKAEQ